MTTQKFFYTCAFTIFTGLATISDLCANNWHKDMTFVWGNPGPLEQCAQTVGIETSSETGSLCCVAIDDTYYRCTSQKVNNEGSAHRYKCKGKGCNPAKWCRRVPSCGKISQG